MIALLGAWAALAQAPAAEPLTVDGAFRIFEHSSGELIAAVGDSPHFLAIGCAPGDRRMRVSAHFPYEIGYNVRTGSSGGYRIRYSFDGGEQRGGIWSGVGNAALATGSASAPHDFVRRLRGSTSVQLRIRRRGGGWQVLGFRYPDPTEVIETITRRCGIDLDR